MTFIRTSAVLTLAVALAGSAGLGCSRNYIPNTDVEDTADNRRVILFCEEYRRAVEDKSIGKLLSLASPHYFEDGGNTTGADDMDLEGLRDYLTTTFVKTISVRYEIRYRRLTFERNNRILVDYTYAAAYKIPTSKGEEWRHTVADNRLVIVPDGENFKILSGM